MSNIKFRPNLFLGTAEWNCFQDLLNQQIKRNLLINTDRYGIVKQFNLPETQDIDVANSFYVSKAGTPYDEVIIHQGVAIDIEGNFIINDRLLNFKIPADGAWYWLAIRYRKINTEKGVVSISADGSLIGNNTEFTKKLRGGTEFNSKIRFITSNAGNFQDYEVAKVIDDTSAILSGDFQAENDLQYAVYGTYLDGYQVPSDDKLIFEYDSFEPFLLAEENEGQIRQDHDFIICKARNNGIDITIEDQRTKWWKSEATSLLTDLLKETPNKLLGVDNVKHDVLSAPKDENLVTLSWNMKSISYTIDTNSKKISLLIAEGGRFKDTSYFQAGDFNNWRVYAADGSYSTIIDSQKSGTQIVVTLDILIPESFPSDGDEILICPPFESIEFKIEGETNQWNEKIKTIESFNINDRNAVLRLKVVKSITRYNLQYRWKTLNDYTEWKSFVGDAVGYYDESSFDNFGNLNADISDRVRVPYEPTVDYYFLQLKEHALSYQQTIDRLDTGELMGVNKTLFKNENPLIHLVVGTDRKYQHFMNDIVSGDVVPFFQLTADATIILEKSRSDGRSLKDGNTFFIHVVQHIDLNNFKIRIVQDYINATTYTELMEFTQNDVFFIRNNKIRAGEQLTGGLFIRATWSVDWDRWILSYETDQTPTGEVRFIEGDTTIVSKFHASTKEGIEAPYFGWKLRDDWNNKFVKMGDGSDYSEGGAGTVTLSSVNIPSPDHFIFADQGGGSDNPSGHNGQYAQVLNSTGGNLGYAINGTNVTPSVSKTSKAGGSDNPTAITIDPLHKKLIAIQKFA